MTVRQINAAKKPVRFLRVAKESSMAIPFIHEPPSHPATLGGANKLCPIRLQASARDPHCTVGFTTSSDLIVPTADARIPFGGRSRSGFGVTRGAEGLLELTNPKVVTVSRGKFRPAFDSPRPGDGAMFTAYCRLAHGRGLKSRWAALVSLIRSISRRSKSSPQDNT